MSSNVNSSGVPVDHDGEPLEYGSFEGHVAPFAVSGEVFRELFMGSGQEIDAQHLEAKALETPAEIDPVGLKNSSSGGIPFVDTVEIEDVTEGYQSDEPIPPPPAIRSEMSETIQAVLRTSKHERDALYATRSKLMGVLSFLRKKGFTEEQIYADMVKDDLQQSMPKRDDFGLPSSRVVHKQNPFKDKMKGKEDANEVFDENPQGESTKMQGATNASVKEGHKEDLVSKGEVKPQGPAVKSWANVLQNDKEVKAKFGYYPLEKDCNVVEPPLDVLKKGNEKFRCCVVGTFTKGTKSYRDVADFARKMWSGRGLLKVLQKDINTYVLQFDSEVNRDVVLARGTWYIGRRPMVVTCWGMKPGLDCITAIPLWIKLNNVPDSYWTEEGLSRLASVVGKPIGADDLTAKLYLLPFAKIQVLYKLGDPMPNEIQACVLDPVTEQKSFVKVEVVYPFRPLFCSGCSSLGHSIGACPKVTRVWVKKDSTQVGNNSKHEDSTDTTPSEVVPPVTEHVKPVEINEASWTEVKRKKAPVAEVSSPEVSPSPPRTFRNLKNVDEVEKKSGAVAKPPVERSTGRLTKSQKKKLKLQKGSSPTPTS